MTPEQERLRESVAKAIYATNQSVLMPEWDGLQPRVQAAYRANADAAIAVALEKAARMLDEEAESSYYDQCDGSHVGAFNNVAAAIRALIPSADDPPSSTG